MSPAPPPRVDAGLASIEMLLRWLWPAALLLAFLGYTGPWVDHKAAGLVITGLDLGEYVKFLTPIRRGELTLWREGFYLPLLAISLTASLIAFRAELRYSWPIRAILLALAIVAALNLLPPAWTPQRMLTAEFRQQAVALAGSLLAMAFSPLLALLPHRIVGLFIGLLSMAAALLPIRQFFVVLPIISALYNRPQAPGWGTVLCVIALLTLGATALGWAWKRTIK
ncbi:MAG: hypothetical protein NZ553_11175 [Caldilinea sp.]|nr:hypothetical protein [Caldilinea sp.]MDW8441026.1 hypothetical protein [Caldilineaceae bacterium]